MNVETWHLGEFLPGGRSPELSDAISRVFGDCDCGYHLFDSNITASLTNVHLGPITIVRYFGQGVHWANGDMNTSGVSRQTISYSMFRTTAW